MEEEEWKRVQREVDVRNYLKSFDHQGITFKAADEKAISTKAFVSQIDDGIEESLPNSAGDVPHQTRCTPRKNIFSVILLAMFFSA